MSISEIQLFQALKIKLGEKEAEELVQLVKTEVQDTFSSKQDFIASKVDLHNAAADLVKFIYFMGLVQFLAIIGSVLLIFNFMLK